MDLTGITLSGGLSFIEPKKYYMGLLGGASNTETFGNSVIDSDGSLYIVGTQNLSGPTQRILLAKYSYTGKLLWQKNIGLVTGYNTSGVGLILDSSNNIYVSGNLSNSPNSGGDTNFLIIKLSNSGDIIWQKKINSTSSPVNYGRDEKIFVDSSNNIYVLGSQSYSQGNSFVAKLDSSGTILWQQNLQYAEGRNLNVDSSGNVYITGLLFISNFPANSDENLFLMKIDSSGTLQWRRMIAQLPNSGYCAGEGITFDSSNNVYVVGWYDRSGGNNTTQNILLAKYNSSGDIQWQKQLGGSSGDGRGQGIVMDASSTFFYIIGYYNAYGSTGFKDILIAKYNLSGDLQWQRYLGNTRYSYGYGISLDTTGNLYVGGTSEPNSNFNDLFFAKLPIDGSLTGNYVIGTETYNNYTYKVSTLPDATNTNTESAATFSITTSSYTISDATTATSVSTATSNVTFILA